jgi:hypothetical protein
MFRCLNMNRYSIYILILLSYFTLTILVDNHNCSEILIAFRCLNIKLNVKRLISNHLLILMTKNDE